MTRGAGAARRPRRWPAHRRARSPRSPRAADRRPSPRHRDWEATNLLHRRPPRSSRVAHLREETRGGHLREDFPERDDAQWLRPPHRRPWSADGALDRRPSRPVEAAAVTRRLRLPGSTPTRSRCVVRRALDEDLGPGADVTTWRPSRLPRRGAARRGPGRRRGRRAAVSRRWCSTPWRRGSGRAPSRSSLQADDGDRVRARRLLATLTGPTRPLLVAERTALNLLCRACPAWRPTPGAGPTRSPGPARWCSTPARPRRGCGRWRSTRCAAAAAPTSGWACTTSR